MFSFLSDWLFPRECLGCGQEGDWLCPVCFRELRFNGPAVSDTNILAALVSKDGLDAIHIAGDYSDPLLAAAIKRYKFGLVRELAPILGSFLASYWSGQLVLYPERRDLCILPIPLSQRRLRWRGFNQAALLADCLAAELALPQASGLARIGNRPPQSSLPGRDRPDNIAGVFTWEGGETAAGRHFLLVDDIVTTGATMNEAARTLKQAGVGRVEGLVLAKG